MVFFILTTLLFSQKPKSDPDIRDFISFLQTSLGSLDIQAYTAACSPGIRELEEARISNMFDHFGMDSLALYPASIQIQSPGEYQIFLQMFFQNPHSVILEIWQLTVHWREDQWQIIKRELKGQSRTLFKIDMPSDRIERIKTFQVRHEDIFINFNDAVCFYDNIPTVETALIILGKGKVIFTPSDSREQHQLEMIYKQKKIEDELDYLYLRFSNSFFRKNIKIVKPEENTPTITESERKKAYSIFTKHYVRSFTTRNSFNGELLSLLPQGNEAMFEFDGKKIGDVSYIYSPFALDEINFYQWKKQRILNLYSPPLKEKQKRMVISFGQKFDVKNIDVEIDFNPGENYFAGLAKVKIESAVNLLDGIMLKLNPDLNILRVNDEKKRELYYTRDSVRKVFYVYFLDRPSEGDVCSLDVYYRGKISSVDASSEALINQDRDIGFRTYSSGYEDMLYTGSSLWYPAPSSIDYFTARVRIITSPGYQVVASGRLIDQYKLEGLDKVEDVGKMGNMAYVFESKTPLKYLAFFIGYLTEVEASTKIVPLHFMRARNTRPENWDLFHGAEEILGFYAGLFGDFPYEKLCIVKRPGDNPGGHSPPSFIVLDELPRMMAQPPRRWRDSPVDLSRWKEYMLAHEIAHQWWGQGIAWKSYRDIWISEGMAQFAAVMFLKDKYGEGAYTRILKKFAREVMKKSEWGGITMGSRISYFDFNAFQTIVYNKAAMVLNMLRNLLGDELFYQGLKQFFNQHKFTAAGTGDFIKIFQEISSFDLTGFFAKWFNSYRLPEVRVFPSLQEGTEGNTLQFNVNQINEPFTFPLWIEWRENGAIKSHNVIVSKQTQQFSFAVQGKPDRIKINPQDAVPGKFSLKK